MAEYTADSVDTVQFSEAVDAPVVVNPGAFDDLLVLSDTAGSSATYGINDTVVLSEDLVVSTAYGINDTLVFSESILAKFAGTAPASDTLTLEGAISYVARALAEDGLNLADLAEPDLLRLAAAADLLQLVSTAESSASVLAALVETLVLNDFARFAAEVSAEDTISLAEQVTAAIKAQVEAEDTLTLLETLRSSVVILASDTLELSEGLAPTLKTVLAAEDTLVFIGSIPLEDGDYQAWVMNADTTGVTTYSNFPMDSLFTHEGVPYGLTSTGLYQLEGDDDDGEAIDAVLASGDIEFGTSREKNVPRCYLYITQQGEVILKTITNTRGSRHETYYELEDRTTDGDDDNTYRRVPLGRGVRGIWWRFEIHNVDGSTIDFSGAEVLPVVLSRRG